MKRIIAAAVSVLLACSFAPGLAEDTLNAEKKPATTITEGLNAAVYQQLDFSDEQETEFARRGLIAAPESLIIKAENGMTIWSQDAYDFVREAEDVPSSANPSL